MNWRLNCTNFGWNYGLLVLFAAHLFAFFGWLIPRIGQHVAEKCHGFWACERRLTTVSPFSSKSFRYFVDVSDGQWREFRSSLPLLIGTMLAIRLTKGLSTVIVERTCGKTFVPHWHSLFRAAVGLIVLVVQHGLQSLIVLTLAAVALFMTKALHKYRFFPYLLWFYGIAILVFKEAYRLRHWPFFWLISPLFDNRYSGMYSWRFPANFLVLRIISFGIDYRNAYLARVASEDSQELESSISNADISNRDRIEDNKYIKRYSAEKFGLVNYFAYILYSPLYMAGPVISFEAFMDSTTNVVQQSSTGDSIPIYTIRWLLCLGILEYMTSKFPFFAIIDSGLLRHLKIGEIAVVLFVTLKMMWLKFLIIWRFFRLWALVDGINPPENMLKCMSNNYSLEQFWRGWHSSFNQWLVRYIYKPLGGRKHRLVSIWLVFLFVAIWHDIEWKLLAWGVMNSAFFMVEIAGTYFMNISAVKALPPLIQSAFEVFGGSSYIMVLIAVNVTGYAVGVEGIGNVLGKIISLEGIQVLMVSYYFLTWGVMFMKYLRAVGISKTV